MLEAIDKVYLINVATALELVNASSGFAGIYKYTEKLTASRLSCVRLNESKIYVPKENGRMFSPLDFFIPFQFSIEAVFVLQKLIIANLN